MVSIVKVTSIDILVLTSLFYLIYYYDDGSLLVTYRLSVQCTCLAEIPIVMTSLAEIILPVFWILLGNSAIKMMVRRICIMSIVGGGNINHFKHCFVAWKMEGTEWFVKGDIRLRTEYGRKIPRVESRLEWQIVTLGKRPENGMTNDEWIRCEPFFRNVRSILYFNCFYFYYQHSH